MSYFVCPQNRRSWYADLYASVAADLLEGAHALLLGGPAPCNMEKGDPAVRVMPYARMDLVLKGKRNTVLSRNGRRVTRAFRRGDVCYWAPDAWAGEQRDCSVRYAGVVFRREYLRSIVVERSPENSTAICVHHTEVPLGGAAEGTMRALDVLASERDSDETTERHLCAALLRLARRHLLNDSGSAPRGAQATWRRLYDHLVDFAELPLQREDVAAALDLSPGYISEICQAQAGQTFRHVLERIRIERACGLLRIRPELTVAQIAHQCGYKDPSYFGRAFNRVMGCTPGMFRAG